jgi:hypothetical protein
VSSPIAPWHMWGSSAVLEVVSGAVGPANATVAPAQLARLDYKRPETWRFLLWGRLTGGTTPVGFVTQVHALFDVFVGVGRSVLDTQKAVLGVPVNFNAFSILTWQVPVGTIPGQQNFNVKYVTQVPAPQTDDSAPAAGPLIDHLVAESISCRVRFVMSGGDPGARVQAEVGSFFAPNVHVRPDWFSEKTQFLGSETGGT